jgi:hypothetical protein
MIRGECLDYKAISLKSYLTLNWTNGIIMIELLSKLEVCISQRLDQMEMLREDNDERLLLSLKEDDKKRQIIRNFRLIRKVERTRSEE